MTERTKGSQDNSQHLLMDLPFYTGLKIPAVEHLIGQDLTGQRYVGIQGWMGLAGVLSSSSNPTYHCLTQELVYLYNKLG